MTPITTSILILLASTLISVVAWIGNKIDKRLESIAESVGDIKEELSALVNDHENVKDDIKELKVRIYDLEHTK